MNTVIVVILTLLLVFSGALGVYSYDLNKEIISLSDNLTSFREETATQIGILSDELTSFREETATQIGILSDELKGVSSEISQSVINVSKLYEMVKSGVVIVSDGKNELGSGFVFDAKGYIVTNYHVVEEASMIEVVSHDGATSKASIIGSCKYSDIAVLKLKGEVSLEPLELGDSNAVAVGEPVIVIGSPFNLPGTVTSGIVSQKGRSETFAKEEPYYMIASLIQHNAAINPGNSGGPLLNSRGEVTGLNIGRIKPELGDGIYFAICSNKVKRVARSLIDHRSFNNPTLPGKWTLQELTPEKARAKDLDLHFPYQTGDIGRH